MTDRTFKRLQRYVVKNLGIKMPDAKKIMLQSRLQKRLRAVGKKSYDEYCDYVFSNMGTQSELPNMIDAITTNKTDFFREPVHFDFLTEKALPELFNKRIKRTVSIWSAGCSTGEEPYTLAMVLSEFKQQNYGFHFNIFATDISTEVLQEAQRGIYRGSDVVPVPIQMKKKYLLKSKNGNDGRVRIIPQMRSQIKFSRLNFMDEDFGKRKSVDIIFCRNVLIYFSRANQEKVVRKLCKYLYPGGYLCVGHSETLSGLDLPLKQVQATIYQKE